MLYKTPQDWRDASQKRVLFYGMSGLGKTVISEMLAETGDWFHYSVDYRIGTRYMGEPIADNLKREAMKNPFLCEMLMKDLIHISANVHDHDLGAVSAYLGKPGDPAQGGLPIEDYRKRQEEFRKAEIAALMDTESFIARGTGLYGYPHFICDTGGSTCEWADGDDPNDPILTELSRHALLVWIKGDEAHTEELIRRFDRAPKPMAYQPEFLTRTWEEYLRENKTQKSDVHPDDFIRYAYARALAHRQPRYAAMAKWGVTVTADDVYAVKSPQDFDELIATAISRAPS